MTGIANAKIVAERPSITVIVLTFNEELHIRRCLERVRPVAGRLVVIDSFSSDHTVEIAREMGADVFQRPFKHQADQFQWALNNVGVNTEWVLRLDADEYLEDGLIVEVIAKAQGAPAEVTGFYMKLKVIFRKRWIRFGGYYSTWLLRMWRTGVGSLEQRWMDERTVLAHGQANRLTGGDLVDQNLNGIGWWTAKHNRYATRQMIDFMARENPSLFEVDLRLERPADSHVAWKRFLRNVVFARSPLYLRSILYFLQRYFLRLGFLDGREGFVWHFLHGFWFFVLIDAKIDEARGFVKAHGVAAFRAHLSKELGIGVV